jgi:hypothetical protein
MNVGNAHPTFFSLRNAFPHKPPPTSPIPLIYSNMKEIRFNADDGVWRVAFAFDPQTQAFLLVAGDKSGGSQQRFYRQLIAKADERFGKHLNSLEQEQDDH